MNTFDWIELRTRDAQRAALFYESSFGWRIKAKGVFARTDHNR
jgi:predicted enzyme related to lactoylglutathione lyase